MQPSNPDAIQSIHICHQCFGIWMHPWVADCTAHMSHSASGAEFAGIKTLLQTFAYC